MSTSDGWQCSDPPLVNFYTNKVIDHARNIVNVLAKGYHCDRPQNLI